MIKNIIFDWSGVLSNDWEPVYKAVSNVFLRSGIGEISRDEFKKEFTLPVENFYKKYTDIPYKEFETLFLEEINKVEDPVPYQSAKKELSELKNRGINMIIFSSHPKSRLIVEVEKYGFLDYFKEINGSVRNKVESIKEVLNKNNFITSETAYIGDMNHDIEAGKEAGVKTIAITWGYHTKEKLQKENPDFIISDIAELSGLI